MRRNVVLCVAMFLWTLSAVGQDMECIMKVAGAGSEDELSLDEVEHFENLLRHPVDINNADAGILTASGLFTSFQVASLVDYRSRHGDIMSLTELSGVDGFSADIVATLSPFIRLMSGELLFVNSGKSFMIRTEASLRGGYKTSLSDDIEHSYTAALKLRTSFAEKSLLALSFSQPYNGGKPDISSLGGNIMWNHRCGKVLLGDFNARFGQGLCVWNTMVVGSGASPSSMMRKPSGLSASYSFTGSSVLSGAGADFSFGRWRLAGCVYFPGIKGWKYGSDKLEVCPVVNLQRIGRLGHVAMTHMVSFSKVVGGDVRIPQMRTASDFAICIRGINIYGEVAFDWVRRESALVLGSDLNVCEGLRMGGTVRYVPFSEEHGTILAGEYIKGHHCGTFSINATYHPYKERYGQKRGEVKLRNDWTWKALDFLSLSLRASERIRNWGPTFRTDLRADAAFQMGQFFSNVRVNLLSCLSLSGLGYLEGGFKSKRLDVFIREGVFFVDKWDDRIYVYERDAPGSFNVPAFYGRGLWTAIYCSCRVAKWGNLYCRASYVSYPFMEKKKPGKAELKLMMTVKF